MDTAYKDFVRDIVYSLREKAAELSLHNEIKGSSQFDLGRELALREVLSTMQNQAEAFGLDQESICLAGFDALAGSLAPVIVPPILDPKKSHESPAP